jgi:hypothetical protein
MFNANDSDDTKQIKSLIMKNYLLYMASALLLFSACTSSDENRAVNDGQQQEDGIPIMLEAGIKHPTRAANNLQNDVFEKGATINVYLKEITPSGYSVTTKYTPIVYTTTNYSGALSPQNNIYPYFPTNGRGITVLAMYPSTEATKDSQWFTVESDQKGSANYKRSDLMVAFDTIPTPTSTMRTLQFHHLMSKITVQVVRGTGNADISNSQVTLYNVKRKIGFIGSLGTLGELDPELGTVAVTDDCSSAKSCIIPPQDIDPCRFFRIKLGSKDIIYYYNTQTLNFLSGHEYKFVITVNQNSVNVTYTVGAWEDEENDENVISTHADREDS